MSKLIRIERTIAQYNISDKDIVSEENIDSITLENLLLIVSPRHDDPLLYDGYVLDEKQLVKINSLVENKLIFDFDLYYYVLECSGIYDYEKK